MQTQEKLEAIRKLLAKAGVDAFVQPVHDEYLSEYPPACYQRATWISGFTGSAGAVIVTKDKAAIFVDGRYTLQAANEVDGALFEIHNSGDTSFEKWLESEKHIAAVGYDAALFTPAMLARMKKTMRPMANPVDALWQDRPAIPATPVFLHDDIIAGESSKDKCARLGKILAGKNADAALIAAPDSVCWLLNIRARDVECTPLVLARALLYADGTADVFIDPVRLPNMPAHIRAIAPGNMPKLVGKTVLADESQTPESLLAMLRESGAKIQAGSDPCILPKACKNATQLAGMRAAHIRDGAAVAKLLHWLAVHPRIHSVSEMEVAESLLSLRKQNKEFVEPSFPTIAGSGPHGAIVHYRATEQSNRLLKEGELLLLDSGGQYPDGTTDITRTIAIGEPTAEYKDRFTRVLKGHIALANAIFPHGTRGSQLDALARQYLWQVGLDYDHGTGHGVGQFLGVHEGPQRIGKRGGDAVLEAGMILSNEPGYYKENAYGIRIENLVIVVEKSEGYLGFETITCAPLDRCLVDESLLSESEKSWLDNYQSWVKEKLAPLLTDAEKQWLENA